jgi:general L-amino acid transport system permease protein
VQAHRRQAATGQQSPVIRAAIGFVIGLPLLAWTVLALVAANPISFDMPIKGTFNLRGGMQVFPELVALTLGLVIYTAAFIAEIVRAGILAVSKGQTEAAHALGIKPGQTLRLVVIPQAMRVIIPPLTSQYLNLTKNSSLAVVIGYPDLVQVFMGTVLNQTGQAIECVAITMAVYLTISIATATFMNAYNARKALVER